MTQISDPFFAAPPIAPTVRLPEAPPLASWRRWTVTMPVSTALTLLMVLPGVSFDVRTLLWALAIGCAVATRGPRAWVAWAWAGVLASIPADVVVFAIWWLSSHPIHI